MGNKESPTKPDAPVLSRDRLPPAPLVSEEFNGGSLFVGMDVITDENIAQIKQPEPEPTFPRSSSNVGVARRQSLAARNGSMVTPGGQGEISTTNGSGARDTPLSNPSPPTVVSATPRSIPAATLPTLPPTTPHETSSDTVETPQPTVLTSAVPTPVYAPMTGSGTKRVIRAIRPGGRTGLNIQNEPVVDVSHASVPVPSVPTPEPDPQPPVDVPKSNVQPTRPRIVDDSVEPVIKKPISGVTATPVDAVNSPRDDSGVENVQTKEELHKKKYVRKSRVNIEQQEMKEEEQNSNSENQPRESPIEDKPEIKEDTKKVKQEKNLEIQKNEAEQRETRKKKEKKLQEQEEKEKKEREEYEKRQREKREKKDRKKEREKLEQIEKEKEKLEKEKIEKEKKDKEERERLEIERKQNQQNIEVRLQQLEESVQNWQQKMETIECSQIKLLIAKRDYHFRLIEILKSRKNTESRQAELIECAEYLQAEILNERLEQYTNEAKLVQQQIIESSRDWINLEGDRCSMFAKLTQIRKEGLEDLKSLEELQTHAVEETKRTLREENQIMEYSVGKSMQRIERELHHIKVDVESLEEKEHRIETIIKERTTVQRSEKMQLLDKKNHIVAEISELLTQIEHLRRQENEYNVLLATLDKEIAAARARYKIDLEKIHQERANLLKNRSRLENEHDEINREFEQANKKLAQLSEACQKEETLLRAIEKSIANSREIIKLFDQKILESHEIRLAEEHLLQVELQEQSDLKGLKYQSTSSEDAIKDLTSSILQIRHEIRNLEHSITTNKNTTLPNLDSEKKLAIKRRDFKGAQTLQNNFTDLQDQIQKQIQQKQHLEDKLQNSTKELELKEDEHNKLEIVVKQKSREADLERLQKVYARITELRLLERSLSKNTDPYSQQQNVQLKLAIERAKVTYIRLNHDLPDLPEPPLPSEEELKALLHKKNYPKTTETIQRQHQLRQSKHQRLSKHH